MNTRTAGQRSKGRSRKEKSAEPTSWQKIQGFVKKVRIPVALLTGVGLYFTYTSTGAEELRTKVYQPLYGEISKADLLVLGGSWDSFNNAVMNSLSQSGDLERIPAPLRRRITATYGEISRIQSDLLSVTELVQRNISQQIITGIRTQVEDQKWSIATSKKLRSESEAKPGISDMTSFQFKHTARGRAIDVRNPSRLIVAGPGGPTWTFSDWAAWPDSVNEMEQIWTEDDFLYFDPIRDDWYYRITRSDLRRRNLDLETFLRPIHHVLTTSAEYRHIIESRQQVASAAKALTAELAARIHQPKRLSDLFHR